MLSASPRPIKCRGRLEFSPLKDSAAPGLFVSGWAWDNHHHEPSREVVATGGGVITGLAAVGYKPLNAWTSDAEILSSYAGLPDMSGNRSPEL